MSTTSPTSCTTCQVILLERFKFKQAKLKAKPDTRLVSAAHSPRPSDLAANIKKIWTNGKVFKVWFLNGNVKSYVKHVTLVKEVVKVWESHANVIFEFPSDWDEKSPPEVRILFSAPENRSYIGRDILAVTANEKPDNLQWTMQLNPDGLSEEADFTGTILHEFGHTLGFMHEHQRPDARLKLDYDLPKLYKWYEEEYNWGVSKVDEQVFNFQENVGKDFAANKFDTKSIMMYAVPPEILNDGSTPIPRNNVLSDDDIEWVKRLYPKGGDRKPFGTGEIIHGEVLPKPV